jgi:hypothetical protein
LHKPEITRSGHESFGELPRLHFVQNDILIELLEIVMLSLSTHLASSLY